MSSQYSSLHSSYPSGHKTIFIPLAFSFLVTIYLICFYFQTDTIPWTVFSDISFNSNFSRTFSNSADSSSSGPVTLLMWTSWFGQRFTGGLLSDCPIQCQFIYNKSLINESDAVIFTIRDTNWNDLPSDRLSNQYYVMFNMESPIHSPGVFPEEWKNFYFNISMTYRQDSDVFCPYGTIQKRQNPIRKNLTSLIKSKTRTAVWMASHCGTHSKREILVAKLKEYVEIDGFGGYGDKTCTKDKEEIDENDASICGNIFETNYKFYLALENSLCTDYVTEKFFWRLNRYLVPIVMERRNYEYMCPEYKKPWFIAVDDFQSIHQLGLYLRYLNENNTAYLEYLNWHEYYETVTYVNSDIDYTNPKQWCDLCKFVMKGETRPVKDVMAWWHEPGVCVNYAIY